MSSEQNLIDDRILRIVADHALMDQSDLSYDQKLDSLGFDSVSFVELIYELEEEFDIDIRLNINDLEQNDGRVAQIIGLVKDALGKKTIP